MTNTKEERKNYHGHRDRVRALIHRNGIGAFPPYQVLEYLLFAVVPYKDTKPIAYDLLNTFGSFANILNADVNALARIKGMTYNAALFLHTLPGVFQQYQKSRKEGKSVLDTQSILPYLSSLFVGCEDKERVFLLCFDSRYRLLHTDKICEGEEDEVEPDYKTITEIALRHNAQHVLLVHNHPSQNPSPSTADKTSTASLKSFLSTLGINLCDHVIVCDEYAFSFAQQARISVENGTYLIADMELSDY